MKQAGMKITYAGVDITQWMYVQMVKRDVGTNHVNTMQKVGISDGQMLQYMSRDVKTIVVTGNVMNDDLVPLRRSLAAAIDADEPQQLIFGDEPDKYYLAIVDSQPTFTEGFRSGTISISFVCPDGGIAHSVATKTADNMPYKDVPVNLVTGSGGTFTGWSGYTSIASWFVDTMAFAPNASSAVLATQSFTDNSNSTVYTVSFLAKADTAGDKAHCELFGSVGASDFTLTTSWQAFTAKLTYTTARRVYVGAAKGNKGSIYIARPKLEIGTTASPWSPNPADPEYYTNTITVHNGGTYPAYPVIEATMHSDNGVVTLINENNGGIIQLGNPGEVDGVQAPDSETVFHYDLMSPPSGVAVNTGTINYPTYPYGSNPGPNTIAGSWDYAKAPDAATPVLARTAAMHWAGPSFHGPIKANAAGVNTGNLIWSNRFNVTTSVGALGRTEFNLQSGNDIALCFVIRDSTYAANMLTVEGWVKDHNVFMQDLNRSLFTNGFYEIVMAKLGNNVTFKLTKIKQLSASGIISSAQIVFPPVTINGVSDMGIDSFTVWMAGFSNTVGWTINWSDSVFKWVNVDYWQDLPNRFSDGDDLLIDPSQIKVFVNNVEDETIHAIGNDWEKFRLDPGDTNIKIVCSDFATTPSVAITLREAWL
ncbi:distal tail protein Dit [Lacticaseibacillus paracasei]|uniref:distal tail protein Dit n=1 Tax=Lacticaseibacillus paracasei TaxID=1597 RepID=UPI0021A32832|nr:distal tail protein Dit [Lacticaseibacillus paracasei]MCT4383790.1 phage tail protein [Lacticaseibacillus paracasei]